MDPMIKQQLKTALLTTLGSSNVRVGAATAQVVSAIAAIELPRNEWSDLISQLLSNVTTEQTNLKLASLSTIGFVCESIVRISGWTNFSKRTVNCWLNNPIQFSLL
jgi:importin subunit beta-1